MSRLVVVSSRQQIRPVNLKLLRRAARVLLAELLALDQFALGVCLVDAAQITTFNESFLQHRGSTDVITFDYSEESAPSTNPASRASELVHGEIFICMDETISQARRFRTTWQKELARYLIHGVLHLRGYDDQTTSARRHMKRAEDRLLQELSKKIRLRQLAVAAKVRRF